MSISIRIQNTEALKAELDCIQSRSRERTITVEDIINACASVTEKLDIPKKYMVGVTILVDLNAQKFPSTYRYTPISTHFCATYKRSGWVITDIHRGPALAPSKRVICLHTEESREALIERFENWN